MSMPQVKTTDGYMVPWNRQKIADQLLRETVLAREMFEVPPITEKEANSISGVVERRISKMESEFITTATIRAVTNNVLSEQSKKNPDYNIYINILSRVGAPVYDLFLIDSGDGFEKNENANLQPNPETSHKKKADMVSKEEYLLLFPPEITRAHHSGDLHVHTLEYFGTRPFCQDWDLRYFFRYGFIPDGLGFHSSVAGPAKHPHVALLHSIKALAAGQTNFSGGQGYMNYTMFMAPYLRGLDYKQVKQIAQMMFYELTQMYIARGGQPVFSSIQLLPGIPKIWRDVPAVYKGKVGPETYGDYEYETQQFFKAILEVALEGDYWGKPFNFPKLEAYLSPEFYSKEYDDLWYLVHQVVSKNGSIYFDNMIPNYRGYGKGISCYQCCLTENTLIPIKTDKGLKLIPIGLLEQSDKIYTPDGFSVFDNILKNKIDENIYEFILEGGKRYSCTKDHFIPIIRNNKPTKIIADQILKTDKFILDYTLPENSNLPLTPYISEKYNDYDKDLAWLLGLYAAEGSNYDNMKYKNKHNTSRGVTWSLGAYETELIEKTKKTIEKVFRMIPSISYTNNKSGITLILSQQIIYDWFEDNGIVHYKQKTFIPDFILSAPKQIKWNYIKGYYDGDGCYRENGVKSNIKRIELNTISNQLAEGLLLLLGNLGYDFKYGEYQDKRIGRSLKYTLTLNKQDEISSFFDNISKQNKWNLPIREINSILYNGYVYDPINVVGHNFITGQGLVTGNCAYSFVNTPETDPLFNEKLYFQDGQHFSMGGWQVTSINMPRLAYRANGDYTKLLEYARENMRLAAEVFKNKQYWMKRATTRGLLPFAQQTPKDEQGNRAPPAVDFDELVNVMGVVGINEMVQSFTGYQLHESNDAVKVAVRLLLDMEKYRKGLEMKTGLRLALARTPAESTAQTFAVKDLISATYNDHALKVVKGDTSMISDINGRRDVPLYYSNGTHTYVGANIPLGKKIDVEHKFFSILNGGNIFHVWLGEANPSVEGLTKLTERIARHSQIGYFSYTKDLTICDLCQRTSPGLHPTCPFCNNEGVRWWSRITGYYSDVSGWNEAKRQELLDRYKIGI